MVIAHFCYMNPRPSFRLAMVQMRVEGGQRHANVLRAEERIVTAAREGAQVVLLPEALTLGWTHPSAQSEAEEIPRGQTCARFVELAQELNLYICAGLVEKCSGQIFNSAVLIGPDGRLLLVHRKIYELEIAHRYYALGDRLQVAHTAFGTFGVMICADAFAPDQVLARSLALMGADVILSPSAWAVPVEHDNGREPYGDLWRENYGPVARDFRIWIAGVSNVGWLTAGPWANRKCIGCSLLMGPDGKEVLMGPYGENAETILYADICPVPRPARGDSWEVLWTPNRGV
jgi:predicted amidohydrolase